LRGAQTILSALWGRPQAFGASSFLQHRRTSPLGAAPGLLQPNPAAELPSSSRTASIGRPIEQRELGCVWSQRVGLGKRLALPPRHLLHVLDGLGRRHVVSLCRCRHLAPADIPIIPMLVFGDAASAVCTHRHSSRRPSRRRSSRVFLASKASRPISEIPATAHDQSNQDEVLGP
jgi:hypothetical protein